MKRVSIKDIALRLGINAASVSKALRDQPDVSKELKKKVRLLADKMGYKPNTSAINLQSGKSKTIGLIVPDISMFFFPGVLKAIEEIIQQKGYQLLFLNSNDSLEKEIMHIETCANLGVEGVLVSLTKETKDIEHFQELSYTGVPIIYFDKVLHNSFGHKVSIPGFMSAKTATSKLLHKLHGKNKLVYGLFDDMRLSITEDRLKGYKEALIDNQIPAEKQYCYHVSKALDAENLMIEWWKNAKLPHGLFVMSDELLSGVVAALKKLKLNATEDIHIVAISDGHFAKYTSYPIPYVETSGYLMGEKAAELLFTLIADPNMPVEEHLIDTIYIS